MTEFDGYFVDAFDCLGIEFGETVVYHPRNGESRTITNAIVNRDPPEAWDIAGNTITPVITVRVQNQNDGTIIGILHSEIDDGDQIEVAIKAKDTPTRRTFKVVLNSDGQVTEIAVI